MSLSLTYYPNIPQPGDNPSNSQGLILQNFMSMGAASSSWTTQDHYGFGTGTDGQHLQLNFPSITNQTAPIGGSPATIVYTGPGTAMPTASELFMFNSTGNFPLSMVCAFGIVDGVGITLLNGFNVASVTTGGVGIYNITLTSGVVTGTSFAVLCSCARSTTGSDQMLLTYTISGAGTFSIVTVDESGPFTRNVVSFSFIVMQL